MYSFLCLPTRYLLRNRFVHTAAADIESLRTELRVKDLPSYMNLHYLPSEAKTGNVVGYVSVYCRSTCN